MIRLFYNRYVDPDPDRDAELAECQRLNAELRWLEVISLDGRPTFEQIFASANERQTGDDLTVVCNSDIFFDETLLFAERMQPDECYALGRWDVGPDNVSKLWNRPDAQDTWIFRGPIRPVKAPFTSGVRGCDNRLAHELAKTGYLVSNPSKTIRAHHLHLTNVRRYRHEKEFHIPPPYLVLHPTELGALV